MKSGQCVQATLRSLMADKRHGEIAVRLIQQCASEVQLADWQQLESISFEEEYAEFSKWTEKLFSEDPLPDGTNALFFGLARPGKWMHGYAIAVTGGQNYDASDPESVEVEYVPSDPYAPSESLKLAGELAGLCENQKAASAKDDDPATLIELGFATSYGAILVDRWMKEHQSLPALRRLAPLFVLIGETSGEYYLQGVFKDEKWIRKDPSTTDSAFGLQFA